MMLAASPGMPQPPDSPDPGQTPVCGDPLSNEEPVPLPTLFTSHRDVPSTDSDTEVQNILTPKKPAIFHPKRTVQSPNLDDDDFYTPVPPSIHFNPEMPSLSGRSQVHSDRACSDNVGGFPAIANNASPLPSSSCLCSRCQGSQATGDANELAQANNNSHDGLIENQVLDELPFGSESDSSDADADPMAMMLNGIGLLVIPVDKETSILTCIDC